MTGKLVQLFAAATPVYDHPLFKAVLALHILAAMVWVGGGCTIAALGLMIRAKDEPASAVRELERAARLRAWCFAPASVVLLGCGFGLVALGHFSLRTLWIDVALGGWLVSFVTSAGYLIPESEELAQRARELGPDVEPVRRLVTRLRLAGSFETSVLALVVIDMVVRPS